MTEEKYNMRKSKKSPQRPLVQRIETLRKMRGRYLGSNELQEKAKKQASARYFEIKGTEKFKTQKKAARERRIQDPVQYLKEVYRARTWAAFSLKGGKCKKTQDLLGCSYETLRSHLEPMFRDGMSWDNKGKWHIDHIIPLSSAKTKSELEDLCHYRNLQPLWASENIKKGNKQNAAS